jgi:hypothetical protein
MKKSLKKLNLSRETLHLLDNLTGVLGGVLSDACTTTDSVCPTETCRPHGCLTNSCTC